MASVLNRFSKNLNESVNQVQTDLQSSRFAPLQRRTSDTSIRSHSRPLSVSSISNSYKSSPADPQITGVSVDTATPAGTNMLSSFTSILPPALERKSARIMEAAPVPNAPPGAPPLPDLPIEIPLPHLPTLLDTEKPFGERVQIVNGEFKDMLSAFAHIFWLPLSWFLMLARLGARLFKYIMLLPFTIVITIYERRIRAKFPGLPSIWLMTTLLFPRAFFPSFSSMEDIGNELGFPPKVMNELPTLDVSLNPSRAGNPIGTTASSVSNVEGTLASFNPLQSEIIQ